MFYAFGLMTFAIESLVVCGFFALKDTRTPVLVGLVAVVANIALAWGFLPSMQHLAIAMALVVSKSAKVAVLLWLMKRKLKGLAGEATLKFCIKTAAATGLAGIAGSAVVSWVVFDYKALKILAVSAVFISTYFASCQLLKVSELKEVAFIMLKKKNECNN
jgi:putative peptidoglycan lipid II flippase